MQGPGYDYHFDFDVDLSAKGDYTTHHVTKAVQAWITKQITALPAAKTFAYVAHEAVQVIVQRLDAAHVRARAAPQADRGAAAGRLAVAAEHAAPRAAVPHAVRVLVEAALVVVHPAEAARRHQQRRHRRAARRGGVGRVQRRAPRLEPAPRAVAQGGHDERLGHRAGALRRRVWIR